MGIIAKELSTKTKKSVKINQKDGTLDTRERLSFPHTLQRNHLPPFLTKLFPFEQHVEDLSGLRRGTACLTFSTTYG